MGLQRVRHNWETNTCLSLEMTSCPWEFEYSVGQISCLWTLTKHEIKVILIYVAVLLLFVYMPLFASSLRTFRKSSVTELNQNTKNWQQGLSHDKMCISCSTLIALGLIFFFFFWILVKLQDSQSQFSHFSLVSLIILKYSPISPNPTEIFIFTYSF